MTRVPHMPLFVDDFEAATAHLTLEEDGAYNRLLRLCWRSPECAVPNDPAWITRRLRINADTFDRVIVPLLAEFFTLERGKWHQKRQRQEWSRVQEMTQRRKTAGKLGGLAKSLKKADVDPSNALASIPIPNKGDISPANAVDISLSRSKSKAGRSDVNGGNREIDEAFEAWWRIYPRRVAKTAARKAYARIITKGEASHEDLAAGAARFADAVAGSEARFIAHPATWLNAGRWLDEPDPAGGGRARNDQHSRVGEVLRGIALFDRIPRADVG